MTKSNLEEEERGISNVFSTLCGQYHCCHGLNQQICTQDKER